MRLFAKVGWVCALIWFASVACAHARILIGNSLDWLVVSHDHVAIGKLAGIEPGNPNSGIASNKTFKFHVIKSLKGQAPIQILADQYYPDDAPRIPIGTEFLLFVEDDKEADYAINLSSPAERNLVRNIALSMDFNVLKTKKAILGAVQARLRRLEHERPVGFLRLAIPEDKPAFMALWSESACFLRIPADIEFKNKFIEQLRSKDVHARANAAYWLVKFPGQEMVKELKPLLHDTGTQVIQTYSNNQRQDITVYPVRQAAYETLSTWGIELPQPADYYPDYPDFFFK